MNFSQQEQDYASDPIDEMSESSYMKINKNYLSSFRGDNLSGLRQLDFDDDQQQQDNKQLLTNIHQLQKRSAAGDNSNPSQQQPSSSLQQSYSTITPMQYKFYRSTQGNHNNENNKSSNSKSLKKHSKMRQNQHSQIKINTLNKNTTLLSPSGLKKQLKVEENKGQRKESKQNNTFEYYLMRRSHEKKKSEDGKRIESLQEDEKDQRNYQNNLNDKSITYARCLSPQFRTSTSNRPFQPSFNLQSQIHRINYKKLLQREISKNKHLQRHIYKLESKLTQMNMQYDESFKSTKRFQQTIVNSQKVRKENRNRMKQLDGKLQGLKSMFKNKNYQNQQKMQSNRKENKLLKQENQKYRVFVQTLSESIYVLKGHKPKNLQDLWEQWKSIFETFSKKKWIRSIGKSPNSKF